MRGPLAIPQSQLIQLGGTATSFALNPNLPDIATLFNGNHAALVANVGTLVAPHHARASSRRTRACPATSSPIPTSSSSGRTPHPAAPRPRAGAGRIADTLGASYNPNANIPMITSVAGDTLFCNGCFEHSRLGQPWGTLGGANLQ